MSLASADKRVVSGQPRGLAMGDLPVVAGAALTGLGQVRGAGWSRVEFGFPLQNRAEANDLASHPRFIQVVSGSGFRERTECETGRPVPRNDPQGDVAVGESEILTLSRRAVTIPSQPCPDGSGTGRPGPESQSTPWIRGPSRLALGRGC